MATRILVVDDSPTIRTVVSTILERSGYDPKVASDGQDAYDALASGEVKADLVLVDFVMPRMNGYQFCRALRDNAELAMTPVVLMSAKADRIRDQFVQQTGAIDAITKPFDAQALVAVIENALRKVNTHRASSARLPEFEGDDVTGVGTGAGTPRMPPVVEYETRRTHVAQIVAQKLAAIAAKTITDQPDIALSTDLGSALAERLSNEAILEMMEAISELDRQDTSGALLSGDLGVVPIGAILQLLQAENQTGVLVCRSGTAEVRATFRAGAIDLVQSTGAGDEFRLGRFFIEEGILNPAQIDQITQRALAISRPPLLLDDASTAAEELAPARGAPKLVEEVEAPRSSVQMKDMPLTLEPIEREAPTPDVFAGLSESLAAPDTLPWGRASSAPPTEPTSREEPPAAISAMPVISVGAASSLASSFPASSSSASSREWREDPHGMPTLPGSAVTAALAAATQKPRPLGMALLAAGKIVESQLRTALTRQSSELLYEVLRWSTGRFELRREPPSELAENAKLGLPVASVVMEGFRRVDEWRVLERTLGSFDAVLLRDDAAFGRLDIASLPPREKAVLDAVDGDRTVRAIVSASHVSSFDACRILVQFIEARALRRRAG